MNALEKKRARARATARKIRARRAAAKLCRECGDARAPGITYCERCRAKRKDTHMVRYWTGGGREKAAAWYRAKKKAGKL